MKLYKSFLFTALAATAALATGCSDEDQWDAYPQETAYSFAQATNNYSYVPTDSVPSSFEVKIYRSNTNGQVELPLVVDYSGSVLSTGDSVVFADGSNEATCVIEVGEPVIGQSETMTIAIDTAQAYVVSPTGNMALSFNFTLDYTWVAAGSCNFISNWDEAEGKVEIQKAAEYEGNLYRLVSPYYALGTGYCKDPGYHLQFELDENYEPLSLPKLQNSGEASSKGGYWQLYYNPAQEFCAFLREGTLFTIYGGWAAGVGETFGLYAYAEEKFDWNDGYPGTVEAETPAE